MTCAKLVVFLYVLRISASDWISDWMVPIQDQLLISSEDIIEKSRRSSNLKLYEDEYKKMAPFIIEPMEPTEQPPYIQKPSSIAGLKLKLQTILMSTKLLAETVQKQIIDISAKETTLKEIITHGRNGIATVTVTTIGQQPRNYIIREGMWTVCTGVMQPPAQPTDKYNIFGSNPRCLGQEIPSNPDPCVFNSVIKYETIPTRRRLQYIEDDFLCLKLNFNTTLEHYMSVPKRLINETCTNGIIRSLDENLLECGMRVLSEYNYYPNKGYNHPDVPKAYCTSEDRSCKLLVAWHVSNYTIENFEFLKDEPNFKSYFIKNGPDFERTI